MVIDNTSESIELLLAASVATSQATFTCGFNDMSSTTLTPSETNGSSNNTTPVTIVASPSSGYARQVRELMIENNDTAPITVTVRFNNGSVTRIMMKATIGAGESIYYSNTSGWKTEDLNGLVELDTTHVQPVGNIRPSELFVMPNAGNSSTVATAPMQSLGKAGKAFSSISVRYKVVSAGTSITWSELSIYRLVGSNGMGTQQVWYRLGFVDTSVTNSTTGLKTATIPLTGCREGDDLYLIMAAFGTTVAGIQIAVLADVNSSNLNSIGPVTTATAWRPSTQPLYQANVFSNNSSSIWFSWQGT